jgi:hypothetical protein
VKVTLIRVLISALIAGGIAAGAVALIAAVPPVEEQLPPEIPDTAVFFLTPLDGNSLALDETIRIEVGLSGDVQRMQAVEFWIDGVLVEEVPLSALSDPDTASIFWTPDRVGVHVLLARLHWTNGLTASSSLVRVFVFGVVPGGLPNTGPTASHDPFLRYFGFSQSEWVDRFISGLGEASSQCENGLSELGPIQGCNISSWYTSPTRFVNTTLPNKYSFWFQSHVGQNVSLPTAPLLEIETRQCEMHLYVQDQSIDEEGFFIYRAVPGVSDLERIASLQANDQNVLLEYVDPGQSGLLTYVVAAYNTAGEAPSNPVSVTVFDPACSGLDPLAWLTDTFTLPISEPSEPAVPDVTPTPTAVSPAGFTPMQSLNCRAGPATDFPVLTHLPAAVAVPVEARSPNSEWLVVRAGEGLRCWVWAELGRLTGELDSLPVESVPPLPAGITQSAPLSGSGPTRTPCPITHVCP